MATTDSISDVTINSARHGADFLVLLAAMTQEQLDRVLVNLTAAFPAESLLIASPDSLPANAYRTLQTVSAPSANDSWTLTAADFAYAYQLADKNNARAILMLGPESGALDSPSIHTLANSVRTTSTDLAVPCYELPPHFGLVNSAILYPLTRALFNSCVRFPLAPDLGLSSRMAECLAGAAHRFTSLNQGGAPLWPVNEARVAGFNIDQFDVGPSVQPQRLGPDLNVILPLVTGSLFSDIEAKATFWQHYRPPMPACDLVPTAQTLSIDTNADIASMIQVFRLAYTNLREIWSLVLPPNTLLGLKRLSTTDAADFRVPENLWARIVFDFLLAHRLRTLNRGHLLGSLIPLYLAWVAGHINVTASGTSPASHIETVAAAFESEKTYIVSRWRWPDRFNP